MLAGRQATEKTPAGPPPTSPHSPPKKAKVERLALHVLGSHKQLNQTMKAAFHASEERRLSAGAWAPPIPSPVPSAALPPQGPSAPQRTPAISFQRDLREFPLHQTGTLTAFVSSIGFTTGGQNLVLFLPAPPPLLRTCNFA